MCLFPLANSDRCKVSAREKIGFVRPDPLQDGLVESWRPPLSRMVLVFFLKASCVIYTNHNYDSNQSDPTYSATQNKGKLVLISTMLNRMQSRTKQP